MSGTYNIKVSDNAFYQIVANTSPSSLNYNGKGDLPPLPEPELLVLEVLHCISATVQENHDVYDADTLLIAPDLKLFCATNRLRLNVGMRPPELQGSMPTLGRSWKRYFPDDDHKSMDSMKQALQNLDIPFQVTTMPVGYYEADILYATLYYDNRWSWKQEDISEYRAKCSDLSDILYSAMPSNWKKEQLYCSIYWRNHS